MSEAKYKSLACILTIAFMALAIFNMTYAASNSYYNTTQIICVLFNSLVSIVLAIAYIFITLDHKIPGPVFGIVIGALNLFPLTVFEHGFNIGNIISVVLGVIFIICSVNMLMYLEHLERVELDKKIAEKNAKEKKSQPKTQPKAKKEVAKQEA